MKRICLTIFIVASYMYGKGQSNRRDFDFMFKAVQQLPSFKDQFRNGYALTGDTSLLEKKSDFDLFISLYGLISPIRDNHLAFYSSRDTTLTDPPILKFSKAGVDSLQKMSSATDSVAGVYYGANYKLLVVKWNGDYLALIEGKDLYYTQFLLKEVTPNHFDQIGFVKNGKGYFVNRNLVFINDRLTGTPWKKYQQADFIELSAQSSKFEFKVLSDQIAYLRLSSFATYPEHIKTSEDFYGTLDKEISAKHLIVDLRNNLGGGFKTSRKFYDLLKNYSGNIHVLVNNYTVSNAEQFVIDIKNWKNVKIYGETTRGTICYGSNFDKTLTVPSRRYTFYPTDMKARPVDIPFESMGIKPQIALKPFEKDWVQQVVDHIKNN